MVEDLSHAHAAAAEELGALYEARLALEAGRYAQLQAAKTDAELAAQVGSRCGMVFPSLLWEQAPALPVAPLAFMWRRRTVRPTAT
jgi:hypothetical protein